MGDQKELGPGISRRTFMQRAALAGGVAGTGMAPFIAGAAKAAAAPFGTDLRSLTGGPVDHVIVLMMENRSFDHYYGWRTADSNRTTYADHPETGGSARVATHHLGGPETEDLDYEKPDFRGCHHTDPAHGWESGRGQIDHGFLTGRNDPFAIGYYLPQDVEFYAKLANNFTLCDNYYCSLMASTFPNREYMHSAQSGGIIDNGLPVVNYPEHNTGFSWATIWDLLEDAGIPWGYYFVDLPATGLWGPRLVKGTHHLEHFFEDVTNGRLPNVTFVDPGFTTGLRTDEHPYSDIRAGQAFAHNIVKAVVESPLWERTALFINYDEWGGFFDHIQAPPVARDDRERFDPIKKVEMSAPGRAGFGQLGFRVPCTIVSPYARRNALSSEILGFDRQAEYERISPSGRALGRSEKDRQAVQFAYDRFVHDYFYDHTSILKYIETLFLAGAHLTTRDQHANNIGELLDTSVAPNRDGARIVDALPRVPVTSPPCEDEELEGAFIDGPLRSGGFTTEPAYEVLHALEKARREQINAAFNTKYDDDFQRTLESGVFEKFGYHIDQQSWRYLLGS